MSGIGLASSGMMIQHPTGILQSTPAQQQEWIPILLLKRAASWRYLARVFQGGMTVYNTALLSQQEMRHVWNEDKMQRRSLRFFFLGTSIGTILDIPSTGDYIKALNLILQDYDSFAAAESRSKSSFFKSSTRKTTTDGEESAEYAHLDVRNMPFNLDYVVTSATLCDMIGQLYEKLESHHHREQVWTVVALETFQKVDTRFKKILTTVFRELEAIARDVMEEELNSIDPLGLSASSLHNDEWDV